MRRGQLSSFIHDKWIVRAKSADNFFMVAVAVVIGLLGGAGAVFFRRMIQGVQGLVWGEWDLTIEAVGAFPWWWVVGAVGAGGLIVGPLTHFLAREAKGHGVPEVILAVAIRSGVIRPRLVVVKSVASAITLGTGGSAGQEGPIVQIGAALGSAVGQWLRVSGSRLTTFAACGAAAGIAATFNAPVGGALFAVEIILGDLGVSRFTPIVISSVMATVVSRHVLGDHPAFTVPQYQLGSPLELVIYAALGVVAAFVAVAFIRSLHFFEDLAEKAPIPPWLLPLFGGLTVGLMGLCWPQVLGGGYEAIEQAVHGELGLSLLLVLVAAKLLATGMTLGSGGSGGVFAPSLFLGAMVGGAVGHLAHAVAPGVVSSSGAYALVGMGAVVAAATHGPLTAILIVFEMTSDYKLIVPLMAACTIATLLATRLKRESIFTEKLRRRGVDLHRGHEVNILRSLEVRDVMRSDVACIPEAEPLGRLVERVTQGSAEHVYVKDTEGGYVGALSMADLPAVFLQADALSSLVVAGELADPRVPTVRPDQDLNAVMRLFDGRNREELPVVEGGRLLGVVSRRHLVEAYNRELMKRDLLSGFSAGVAATEAGEVSLGEGYRMTEIEAPGEFVGRSIRELDVRSRFDVHVLLLRRRSGGRETELVPGPDTAVELNDRLVVMGRPDGIRRVAAL